MEIAITDGIKVSVETFYLPEYSVPSRRHYVFSYKIKIENLSANKIQLLRRNWEITDITGEVRNVVNGKGVVGKEPIMIPGESFEYNSGCHFPSPCGKMSGTYVMRKIEDNTLFEVQIPEFTLVPSFFNN
ncbi:Co2+/Mg2+ efflux protein ApaG [Flammeovirga aprica]|uniref:Co2+/Mg2+ efflux protein ApaG n=1 Tax=Flammeovirga aprica JL-4 TaxID=694437 RepID=A0A7X9P0X4_9BACT|nr:Co2+/Mg2+ efflux protein ApaG [Flammeovirga aprica]NME67521.1 Co2+/Mg2+ efflux protein ApaG [Flammeovirga aprica JL-4]